MTNLKEKIIQLSKGEFDFPQHDIVFPETSITMTVGEGEVYSGSFALKNQGEEVVSGIVYISSFRIRLVDSAFKGNQITINYSYDGTGLLPGHVERGHFSVVTNAGEFNIHFTAIIEKPFVMTAYGKVDSLDNFRKLALKDSEEARKLFVSEDFNTILKYEDIKIQSLYYNMRNWEMNKESVEEFLVACKQKLKLSLVLEEESRAFLSLDEDVKEYFTIKKNTWGYLPIKINCVGDFLSTEYPLISTEDFVGNSYRLEYYVDTSKLHKGSNFGEIVISTPYEALSYEVVVEKDIVRDEGKRSQEKMMNRLLKSYFDYEAGLLSHDQWLESSLKMVEELRREDDKNELYLLVHANLLLMGEYFEETRWILDSYNYSRFSKDRDIELNSYYLYLTALLSNDTLGQRRVAEELADSYMKNPDSWKILCMLVQVDSEYKIYSERLRALENLFKATKVSNTLFYFEAFKCFRDKTHSLKKLGIFEIRVLFFGAKHKLMTKELALYTANLASQLKTFDPILYKALELSYEMYPESMILSSICSLLIKGENSENQYFKWFEKAIVDELKIPGLYEYYISSLNSEMFNKPFPRTVYLYFMHGNSLDEQKSAILYSNIIEYEDDSSEIYAHYRDEMERFAWNQLEKRNIDDQLKVIYKRFISERTMSQERINALYDICHAYEVTTSIKNIKRISVIGEEGKIIQETPYTKKGAKVYLYSKQDQMIWENEEGRHYVDSVPYESRRLFYELRYLDMCRKYFNSIKLNRQDNEVLKLTLDVIREKGPENIGEEEIFTLSSRTIRETNYENNKFLVHLCFKSFEEGRFDKVTLSYLAKHYSGAIYQMKKLWVIANEHKVPTHDLSERIISHMLFTESLYKEEEIFVSYYSGGAYFRLQQAYLAYISREFVVDNRMITERIFSIICDEYRKGETLLDIVKIAVLKFYSTKKYDQNVRRILKKFLQELSGRQIFFDFFKNYEEEWLIEVQLWDKTLIQYKGQKGSRVVLYYKLQREDSQLVDYSTEVLTPMYENIFVKKIVLFANEKLEYYFKETVDGVTYRTEKKVKSSDGIKGESGRYGRINQMLTTDSKRRAQVMKGYALESETAMKMFEQY